MPEHDWFRDNLDLFVVGGLSPDESLRADRHAAECAACAQELAQRRLLDRELGRLCSPIHFAGDWDQCVQDRWRHTHRPPSRLPALVRWAGAAAAVVVIGALGAAVNAVAQQGMITFPGGDAVVADNRKQVVNNNLKQIGLAVHSYHGQVEGDVVKNEKTHDKVIRREFAANGVQLQEEAPAGRPEAQNNLKRSGAALFDLDGVMGEVRDYRRLHYGIDAFSTDNRASLEGKVSGVVADDAVGILNSDASKRIVRLEQLGLDATTHGLALGIELNDGSVPNGRTWARAEPSSPAKDDVAAIKDLKARTEAAIKSSSFDKAPALPPAAVGGGAVESKPSESGARKSDAPEQANLAKMNQLRAGAEYFKITRDAGDEFREKAIPQIQDLQQKQVDSLKRQEPRGEVRAGAPPQEPKREQATDRPTAVAANQANADAQVAQRKIIRSGDLEFEVSVFDDTVAQITKLIGAIPGAFVATVNSEKLPNGKVKGSVVVRVPPEALDKFVLDLRQALAKAGELKSQKIGSADVTKQYTDIESRLRAARTMEERFIAIIKNGKGEVKDLIAAERELGVWRTKIEEMEGEIRYYNSQVALSTLTITAYEKEIRAAAAMVITEHVTMKIEADDVEKSLQTALLAVTEAKGRVTKSDLKQHAAGQLEAVLSFEVAPAQAGAIKDKLKALGIVTHHDTQRLQQAEGGTAPAGEIKLRTDDVRFDVTLYNVANIQPREAYVLQVVVTDVPAEYKKLLDGVAAAKGQVRVSQLDEKDKTNTFAQLDFDVPAPQRELFDKVLAGLGDVVSRNTTRAGPGESATDRKVGYRLTLKSEASVPPRETFTLNVYSLDVPAVYRKLQDAAAQVKAHVRALQLNEQDKNNITAQFDVDVARTDMAVLDKLLDEAGEVASRTTSRVQPGEIATDRKVGYLLTLRNQIPPRETLDLNIEVADVERSAAALAALVKGVKGRVTAWEATQDAGGKSVAIQLFDVPLAAKDALATQFKAIGKVRGQKAAQNLQAPDGKLATAHLNVRLTNVTPIVASDDGLWPQVRRSLSYAFTLLSVSLMFLIVGVSVLLPWALIVWVGVKVVRRMRNKGQATV